MKTYDASDIFLLTEHEDERKVVYLQKIRHRTITHYDYENNTTE